MTIYVMARLPYPHEYDVKATRFTLVVERIYLSDLCHIVRAAGEDVVAVGWVADELLIKACKR